MKRLLWRSTVSEVEGFTEYGADDKGLYPEEDRQGQLSRVVREWRRGGRPPRRP